MRPCRRCRGALATKPYQLVIWIRWLEGILVSAPSNVERANATRDTKNNEQRLQCHRVLPSRCWALASYREVIHILAERHLGSRFADSVS